MKITINNNNGDSRQSAIVTIDTKYCNYPYAIREAFELALKQDGHAESVIDEVFNRTTHKLKSEK